MICFSIKRDKFNAAIWAAILLLNVVFHPTCAAEGADMVLAIDTSGSMKQSDPLRLRIQAAKMFVSLLGKEDQIAIVGFSGNAVPLSKLTALDSKAKIQPVLDAIEHLGADGKFTNLFEAIAQSHLLLNQSPRASSSRQIILMTDGNMDVGSLEQSTRLIERTLEELAPALRRDNIRLYSIAFTENSNLPLLRLVAQDTHGHFTLLRDAASIHHVFASIFERAKKPDQLPLNEDNFVVDNTIKELTVVASKYRTDSRIALLTPSGKEIDATTNLPAVRWFSAKQFDLITITNPEPGYWELKFSEGGNKAYIVTDLKLKVETSHTEIAPEGTVRLQASLERNGTRVTTRELLATSRFSVAITFPDGHIDQRPMLDDGSNSDAGRGDGIFGLLLNFDKEGQYRFDVTVAGETFDRKKGAFLTVKREHPGELVLPPVPIPPVAAPPTPVHAPEHVPEPKHESAPAHAAEPTPPPEHEPVKDAAPEEDTVSATTFVFAFLGLNLIIGIAGGGYYFWNCKKKKKAKATAADEDHPTDGIDLSAPPAASEDNDVTPTGGSEKA